MTEAKDFLKHKKLKRAENYLVKVGRWITFQLKLKAVNKEVAVQDIIDLISVGAFYFVLLIFAFPIALPLPYPPGFPSICGVPIFLIAMQMMVNKKKVLLPKFIRNYRIKLDLICLIVKKSDKVLRILSKIISAGRMRVFTSPKLSMLYGFNFFILSLCILIPFPGTNFVPAIGIFISCLGLLFKDGLLALIGVITGIAGLIIIYFLSAIFLDLTSKFLSFTYTKFTSISLVEEGTVAFTIGIIIGMIGSFFIIYFYRFIKAKIKKNDKR